VWVHVRSTLVHDQGKRLLQLHRTSLQWSERIKLVNYVHNEISTWETKRDNVLRNSQKVCHIKSIESFTKCKVQEHQFDFTWY
jgi:hypothetical protein